MNNYMSTIDQAKQVYILLRWPLIMYGIIFGFYIGYVKTHGKYLWFSWHPFFMMLSYIGLSSNAALIKKIGGYENTRTHGIYMIISILLSSFAWYVIYSNKEMFKRKHLTTIHGKLGVAIMISYFMLGIFGAIALNPDWGLFRSNKTMRLVHKVFGRLSTAAAWFCCLLGR